MAIEIKSVQESNGWVEVTWVDGDVIDKTHNKNKK